MLSLRDYQQTGVEQIRLAYKNGFRAPLYVLPTGGGKTVVFSYISTSTVQRGKNVLILVHRIELLKQTIQKLSGFGIQAGAISPKFTPNFVAQVQVAMVQTMQNRTRFYPHFDLIIIDEAHHVAADTYMNIINAYPNAYQLGVTGTPIRSDGKGLGIDSGGIFDILISGPTVQELIDRDFLVEPVIYASSNSIDFSGLKRGRHGDFTQKGMESVMDKPYIVGNCVDHYRSISNGDPGVAFCVSRKAAENVAAEFRSAGYKSKSVDGTTDYLDRIRILNGLADGSIDVVTSCDVISEGTDIPAIAVAMLLRPTASLGLYIQQVGRALRPSKGKDCAVILDHVGNVIRHGLPEEEREWSLDGKKPKTKTESIKDEDDVSVHQCENCYRVFLAKLKECPGCGHERKIKTRELEQVEGTLEKMSKDEIKRLSLERRNQISSAKTAEDLQRIARERGYNPRWVKHIMNARRAKKSL